MKIGTAIYLDKLKEDPDFYKESFQVLELQDFIMPDNLEANREKLIGEYEEVLAGYQGRVTIHGPYIDLSTTSFDPMIRQVSIKRYMETLEVASELGARAMVIHSDFDNNKVYDGYDDYIFEENLNVWQDLVGEFQAQGVVALMENVLDKNPHVIKRIVEAIDSPYLKACLDIGHANVHGSLPLLAWIRTYGQDLAYMHLHDNQGKRDQHLPLGEGSIDFIAVFNELKKIKKDIIIVAEIFGGIEEQERNLKKLKEIS